MKNFIQKKQVKITILALIILIVVVAIVVGTIFATKNSSPKLKIDAAVNKIINWSEKNYDLKNEKFNGEGPVSYCNSILKTKFLLNDSKSGKTIQDNLTQIQKILANKKYMISKEKGINYLNLINTIYDSIRIFGVMGCVLYKCQENNKVLFNELIKPNAGLDTGDANRNHFYYGEASLSDVNKSTYLKSLLDQDEDIFKSNITTIDWVDQSGTIKDFNTILKNYSDLPSANPSAIPSILNIGIIHVVYNNFKYQLIVETNFKASDNTVDYGAEITGQGPTASNN